eukprot:scaffold85119_cov91-Phaeocystis_antarctica.AAC.1
MHHRVHYTLHYICCTWYLPCTRSPTSGAPRCARAVPSSTHLVRVRVGAGVRIRVGVRVRVRVRVRGSTHRASFAAARAAFPTARAALGAPRAALAAAAGAAAGAAGGEEEGAAAGEDTCAEAAGEAEAAAAFGGPVGRSHRRAAPPRASPSRPAAGGAACGAGTQKPRAPTPVGCGSQCSCLEA